MKKSIEEQMKEQYKHCHFDNEDGTIDFEHSPKKRVKKLKIIVETYLCDRKLINVKYYYSPTENGDSEITFLSIADKDGKEVEGFEIEKIVEALIEERAQNYLMLNEMGY